MRVASEPLAAESPDDFAAARPDIGPQTGVPARPADAPPDALAREAALDPTRSFIVQAPAGSGKTTLLAQRFLALLGTAERPEEVLAITFTRKAAAEMRHRILDALARAGRREVPKNPNDARSLALARAVLTRGDARGWALIEQPTRLRIQTIDSLNQWLAQRLPVLSRAGAAPTVHERPAELHAEAAGRVVAALEDDGPVAERLAVVLAHLDNDVAQLQRMLAELLGRRDHWLRLVGAGGETRRGPEVRAALEESLASLVAAAVASAARRFPATHGTEFVSLCAGAAARLADSDERWRCVATLTALPPGTPGGLAAWQRLGDFLLTGEGQWRKTVDARLGFPPRPKEPKQAFLRLLGELNGQPGLREALLGLRGLPAARYADAQWAVLDALLDVLIVAAAELELVFAARGQVDFVAVSRAALQALGTAEEPSEFALALDYRIRHVLVDEFQDTSSAQVELLTRLTAGWERGDGRTIFLVGDPMQSIYRFREADVALFLKIRREGLGALPLESLVLEANFRSKSAIVEWVNGAFTRVMPPADDLARGAVAYAPSRAQAGDDPDAFVMCHGLPKADAALEAQRVLDLVRAERARDERATIAVLGRARGHLVAIARALGSAGLRYQGLDLVPLADRLAVRDLVSLTRALTHLADRAAWLACLRAPWCGLDLAALHRLLGDAPQSVVRDLVADESRLARLPAEAALRVARTARVLETALADRGRRSLAALVEATWVELGGPATLVESQDLDDVRTYLERLDLAERAGDLDDPAALEDLLEELYAAPDAGADERLQLMTIHRAKGLEWDVVIVPGLARPTAGERPQLIRWLEFEREHGRPGLVLAPVKARSADGDELEAWLRRLDGERADHELGRLLYVAATRARRRLHLCGHLEPKNEATAPGEFRAPRRRTALAALWDAVGPDVLAGAVELAGTAEEAAGQVAMPRTKLLRLPHDWVPPPPEERLPAPPQRVTGLAPDALDFEWVTAAGRYAGTVVHEELERFGRLGLAAVEPTLSARAPLWERRLRELGLAPDQVAETVERVRHALGNVCADPRGRWLFDAAHREAASELQLTGLVGREVAVAAIDRTFVDSDGVRWIVDFKTSFHGGAELEAFLDRERGRYTPQMDRYAALVRLQEPERPIRLGLYFPLHAAWREWAPGEPPP